MASVTRLIQELREHSKMSMTGNYLPVSGDQLDDLLDGSLDINKLLLISGAFNPEIVSIDKSWNGIEVLLASKAEDETDPLAIAVIGGQPINDEDLGYGPAMFLTSDQVKDIADELDRIDDAAFEELFDSFDWSAADIYPQMSGSEDDKQYLTYYFSRLRYVFRLARDNSSAMVQFLA